MIQGSAEWFRARCGKATASRIGDIMAVSKRDGKPLKARGDYLMELVCERLTGEVAQHFTNPAMQWGIEKEDDALIAYQFMTGNKVTAVGFYDHPTVKMSGASPDGIIGDDGLVEVKCPTTGTHVDTLLGEPVKLSYVRQVQWQLACTGRQWCDWVSYDPRMPDHLQLKCVRFERADEMIAEMERAVAVFLGDVAKKVAAIDKMRPLEAEAA